MPATGRGYGRCLPGAPAVGSSGRPVLSGRLFFRRLCGVGNLPASAGPGRGGKSARAARYLCRGIQICVRTIPYTFDRTEDRLFEAKNGAISNSNQEKNRFHVLSPFREKCPQDAGRGGEQLLVEELSRPGFTVSCQREGP